MLISRRDLLKSGATAVGFAAAAAIPRPLLAHLGGSGFEPVPPIEDPRLKSLAGRALEAARAAGASYADMRLTHTWERYITLGGASDLETLEVGVRALVDGYWGFAGSSVWSPDEMARLGREAVHQAKVNALGKPRVVDLAPAPVVKDGNWATPVKIDPFEVAPLEIRDHLDALALFATRAPRVKIGNVVCGMSKQDKVFAASTGSYCTQRIYETGGQFELGMWKSNGQQENMDLEGLTPAGMGWELFRDQPLRDRILTTLEALRIELELPVKPVDVGRYDVAFDAASVARFLHGTLRPATELDRALGYEANAGGTSYLNEPLTMLGSFQAGASILNVRADRSEPGGCATVRWDDEGVTPDEFDVVKDGVLADFQTTRESAGWLKEYYARTGKPFRSHGCANAPSALYAPLQHSPNLRITPGREDASFDDLIAGIAGGMAIRGAGVDMDFQNLNGLALGRVYDVKKGKRVAIIGGAGVLLRAPEFWRALTALGGQSAARRFGLVSTKGEPLQIHSSSVTAVPAAFKQLTIIDPLRKA
jgi:TldD protein